MNARTAAASRRKEAETAAYGLLADKVAAVTALAELGAAVDTAAEKVTAAQQAHADAQEHYAGQYRTARAAGWSASDLATAGCDQERAGGALRSRQQPRTRNRNGQAAPDAAEPASSSTGIPPDPADSGTRPDEATAPE